MKNFFYRRKILLALLQVFEKKIDNIDFQKYLFLFSQLQKQNNYFNFIPYKHGCVSFQSQKDKRALIFYKLLKNDSNYWNLNTKKNFIKTLKEEDQKNIFSIKRMYSNIKGKKLLKKVYTQFPYYAINSVQAPKILSKLELKEVNKQKPKQREKTLFTIGYEGKSVDEYFNLLVKQNIKILCDVRKNPFSMKYGFSKKELESISKNLNIKYIHIPELGIDSKLRKNLTTLKAYKNLFNQYKKSILPHQMKNLSKILTLLEEEKRLAITCFEKESYMCHRSCIMSKLALLNKSVKIKDL